tara:strand:+ start:10648 stop:19965 length:9318 start_codon:yes stop_codon:yes gene_type:complete
MDPNQLAQYINAYRVSPHLFNDDEVDELTKYASEAGVNFNRNMDVEESKQSGVVSQFIGGIAEGFLGPFNIFGGSTKDPVTSAQQISRSVGSLIGFVPGLAGGPIKWGGSLVAKAGKKVLGRRIEGLGSALMGLESYPIRIANKVLGKKAGQGIVAKYGGNAGQVADSFLHGNTVLGNVAQSAVHLGTASAVSEFWKGPDAMKDSFIHGAIAGGAFGTIGNYKQLIEKAIGAPSPIVRKFSENKLREGIAKGLAGSAFQGGMATMHGADTATQIYEYMLGAYFGSVHPSVHQKIGREYFNKYSADRSKKNYKMMEDPEFSSLPSDARAEVKTMHDKLIGDKFDQIAKTMKGVDPYDVSKGAQELRNAFAEEHYENYSTRSKKGREDMTAEDRLEAQKEVIASHEELGDIVREGTRIGDEINSIKKDKLEGETKRVYDALTKEQVEQIKEGNYDSIYNEFGKRNDFFNELQDRYTGQDYIRQNEEAKIQSELDSDPVLRRFFKDVNAQVQAKESNELTSLEIADKVVKANEKVKTKLGEQKERQQTGEGLEKNILKEDAKLLEIENKIVALRKEDGSISKENLPEFKRLQKEIVERNKLLATDITGGKLLINNIKPERMPSIDKMVEKEIIDGVKKNKDLNSILNKIDGIMKNEGMLIKDVNTLSSYIKNRINNGETIGNNKEPFGVWRQGETSKVKQFSKQLDPVKQEYDRYELFKNEVYKELGVKPTNSIDRALTQSYERFRQNQKQYHSAFDLSSGKLNKIEEYSNGVRKVLSHPILPHEKIYKHGKTYVIDELIEGGKSYDPLAKTMRFEGEEMVYDYLLTPKKMADLMLQVDKKTKGQYIWTPEKDKGKLIVRNYHPDTKKAKLNDILKTKKEREHFKFDQQEFLKLTGIDKLGSKSKTMWKELHEDMFKSNYLYDPKGQFKSALDLVKRSSLLSSKDYVLNVNKFKDFTPDGKLDVIFVDDVASAKDPNNPIKPETYNVKRIGKDGKEVIEKRVHESDVDGYVVLHTELFNKIVKEMGLDPTTSHIKPTIATEIDGKLFLLKGGVHPSQKGFDAVMPNKGSMVVMTSAAKVNPGKTYTAFPNKKNEYKFYKDGKETIPETTKINIDDLRINFGVYGDKHALTPVSIKRQMHSTLAGLNIEAKQQRALMQIFKDSYLGIEKQNKYVQEMLENPNLKVPADFDISKIGHKQIADILNSNSKSPVVKKLVDDIFKINSERKRSESSEIDDIDLMESKNYADRIAKEFKDTDYNTLAVRFLENQSGNFNDAVLRYVTDKYLNPQYDFSASSWVAGNHALFKNRLPNKEIREDHFMLGHSMKDMKHKGYKTLGKAWEAYKDPTLRKKEDSKLSDKEFKEEHLRIAVMRVPSPDISGTRALYFDGFTGKKNGAYDYGTYLRQKDHFNIDGADVDGDKVFLYQGMPKEYLDGVYAKKNNLERNGVSIENKAEKNNSLYDQSTKAELEYINSSISQYMPNALIRSGRSAKVGKDGMGQIVSAKEYLNIIFSDIISKGGKKEFPLIKNGKKYGVLKTGAMSKEILERENGYKDHSLETSSRTADSSGYYRLIDAFKMRDILLNKAMPNSIVIPTKKGDKNRKPTFADLRNIEEYSELFNVKQNLYRSKDQQGKRPNLDAVQNNLSAFNELGVKFQSSLTELGSAFGRPENFIETNLIRPETIDFKKYNRFVREFQGGFKDPSLLKFIRRKKITIVPDLGKRAKILKDGKPIKETTYKTNDLMDATSVLIQNKAGERLYNDMIKNGYKEADFIEFADRISLEAIGSKDDYAKIRSIDPSLRKNKGVRTTEDAETQIRTRRNDIIETAKELGISSTHASRYFDMYMLGSLYPQTRTQKELRIIHENKLKKAKEAPDFLRNNKPNKKKKLTIERLTEELDNFEKYYNKTSRHNYPYLTNEIPNSSKKMFMNTFSQIFDKAVMPKIKAEVKKASVDPIMNNVNKKGAETPQQKNQGIKEKFEELLPHNNLFDLKVSDKSTKAPTDAKLDAKRIVEAFKKFPEHSLDDINGMFIDMIKDRDRMGYGIEEATYTDLKHFANALEEIVYNRPKGNKVSWIDKYLFPKRVAEKQFSHDFSIPVIKEVNFRDAKGKLGRTSIKVPLGTMQHLQNSFGSIYNLQNIVTNIAQEERDAFFTWRKDILDLPNGVGEANRLHQASMTRWLRNEGRNELEKEYNWNEWKENETLYNSLKDKVYNTTVKGKQVKVKGDELMRTIAKQNDAFLNRVYNNLVKSNLDFRLIDTYSMSGDKAQKPNYEAFNKQNSFVKYNPKTGRVNLEFLENKYLKPLAENGRHILKQLGKNGFTAELLGRMRYERQLEEFVKDLPLNKQKAYREKYRQQFKLTDTPEFSGYIENGSFFKGVGEVKGRYFPRMFHGDTKASLEKLQTFMENKRIQLRQQLEKKYIYDPTLTKEQREANLKIPIDKRFELKNNDFKRIENIPSQEGANAMYRKIINEKIAELETMFEAQLGKSLTLDNGSGQEGADYLWSKYQNKEHAERQGHFSKPGSGQSRGEEPMPGASYDFKVVEAYQEQWINSFFKNATSLISKRAIDRYVELDPLKDPATTNEWANLMRDYATDVLGQPSMYNPKTFGLRKSDIKKYKSIIKAYEDERKGKKITFKKRRDYTYAISDAMKEKAESELAKNKKFQTWDKRLFYYVTDEAGINGLDKISTKLWGRKDKPKLPFYGELPQSPEARRQTLSRILHKIGASEAKWQLITLLSHPKTAVANILGGSHNTISNAGLHNFTTAVFNKKKLLATTFKGTKLNDGTEITTSEHLRRFAEESGAHETFYVTEASLERKFAGKETKEFLKEVQQALKSNSNLSEADVFSIAKKYKVTDAVTNIAAIPMRWSEKKLRTDSFFAHYLNAYNNLKDFIPNIKHNDPYVINMALKGVEATQFLYHSAFRPNYSRTAIGKMMTRFHPFAWNSVRFRRQTYQRAKRYGFKPGTESFEKFKRLATLDIFALSLANMFTSSVFDATIPPPLNWMQDTADWLFGDERERERAFFSSWPHPALAPLQIVTPPIARYPMTLINATINGNWERFADYYLWTFFPFGRFGRSIAKTIETPEMWVEQMTGIPIHGIGREKRNLVESE